jgi:sugar lactone lactonase YvrE
MKRKLLMHSLSSRKMSAPKVEQISASMTLGEGPHWDQNSQALYYVNIEDANIHKYVPATNKHTTLKIGMY